MNNDDLDMALLQAHADDDRAALISLYTRAADRMETAQNIDAACFFLTQAFVYALEHGATAADDLNRRLVAYGRAHPRNRRYDD